MTRAEVDRLLQLPLPERYELAQILWESVESTSDGIQLTARERKLLDESLEAHARDPEAGEPWPQVKAELLKTL